MRNPFARRHVVLGVGVSALTRDQFGWDHDAQSGTVMITMPTPDKPKKTGEK